MGSKDKKDALATQNPMAMARPSFLKEGDVRGTENITSDDIRLPALRIAQAMTPETKRTESVYLEGLREGDFFNPVTREIYGEGPLELVIVNQLGHRHVEFEPGNTGAVLDFNVPDGDPRTQFTTEIRDGKEVRVKPKATKFYDYLVLVTLPDGRRELMTISFKSTQLKKATTLNTQLKAAKVPSFALRFKATPVPEKKGNNSFYGWKIDPAGWVDEEVFNEASEWYEKMRGKNVVVDVEQESDDPAADQNVPF